MKEPLKHDIKSGSRELKNSSELELRNYLKSMPKMRRTDSAASSTSPLLLRTLQRRSETASLAGAGPELFGELTRKGPLSG